MPNLKYSTTKAESIKLNEKRTNTIIISASGMCDAGRIQHHLLQNLWRPESTILFVGYQAEGTLGRQIVSGDKDVEVLGKQITVNARIEDNRSYSAHADQRDLLKWIGSFKRKPKTVYIVHGEENAQAALSKKIEEELKLATVIPDWLDQVELEPLTV
jgi:metallo-beta-lactamase family protein